MPPCGAQQYSAVFPVRRGEPGRRRALPARGVHRRTQPAARLDNSAARPSRPASSAVSLAGRRRVRGRGRRHGRSLRRRCSSVPLACVHGFDSSLVRTAGSSRRLARSSAASCASIAELARVFKDASAIAADRERRSMRSGRRSKRWSRSFAASCRRRKTAAEVGLTRSSCMRCVASWSALPDRDAAAQRRRRARGALSGAGRSELPRGDEHRRLRARLCRESGATAHRVRAQHRQARRSRCSTRAVSSKRSAAFSTRT